MSLGTKSASPIGKRGKWASLVSDVSAEWLETAPPPRAISATRGTISVPPGGPCIAFESSLERDFLAFCRTDHRVARVRAQQLVLHFYDRKRRVRRRYTPDFVVEMAEGVDVGWSRAVIEVKRRFDLIRARDQLQAPLAAVRLWADQQPGVVFKVVTDQAMAGGHWLANARLMSGQIDKPHDAQFEQECAAFLIRQSEFRISEILALAQQRGLNPDAVLAVLYRMVARGELYLDRGAAIRPQTWVSVVGAQKRF